MGAIGSHGHLKTIVLVALYPEPLMVYYVGFPPCVSLSFIAIDNHKDISFYSKFLPEPIYYNPGSLVLRGVKI